MPMDELGNGQGHRFRLARPERLSFTLGLVLALIYAFGFIVDQAPAYFLFGTLIDYPLAHYVMSGVLGLYYAVLHVSLLLVLLTLGKVVVALIVAAAKQEIRRPLGRLVWTLVLPVALMGAVFAVDRLLSGFLRLPHSDPRRSYALVYYVCLALAALFLLERRFIAGAHRDSGRAGAVLGPLFVLIVISVAMAAALSFGLSFSFPARECVVQVSRPLDPIVTPVEGPGTYRLTLVGSDAEGMYFLTPDSEELITVPKSNILWVRATREDRLLDYLSPQDIPK